MNQITGRIRIRPHLLRYVAWREGLLLPEQPIIIPGVSPVTQGLDLCLVNKGGYLAAQLRREESRICEYDTWLHYQVSGSRYSHNYLFVTNPVAMAYNIFLHHLLHDDLRQRILHAQAAGVYEFQVIKDFIDDVGMADFRGGDFDAIKKAQYRMRRAAGYTMQRGKKSRFVVHTRQTLSVAV
jgi:hypothetical protein